MKLAFRLSRNTILINLMLLDCLGQSLPLPLILLSRVENHLVHLIERWGRRVQQVDLAVLVADYNVRVGF